MMNILKYLLQNWSKYFSMFIIHIRFLLQGSQIFYRILGCFLIAVFLFFHRSVRGVFRCLYATIVAGLFQTYFTHAKQGSVSVNSVCSLSYNIIKVKYTL